MGRQMKAIQLYMITIVIAGCAKGGLTSSMKNNKINAENLPEQTLPIEDVAEPVSDIDNPKNNSTVLPTATTETPTNPALGNSEPVGNPFEDPNSSTISPIPGVLTPWEASNPTTKPPVKKPAVVTKPPTKPVVSHPTITIFNFLPLVWEKTVTVAKDWSHMIYSIIKKEEPILLGSNIADDIEIFCPTFRILEENQRLNFWGQFFAAVAFYESGWKPTSQFVEKNITSKDSVTKKQVVSEGLLQLSYQDQKNYPFDCGFDWAKDSTLSQKDPTKTILDPYLNLRCGIKIMTHQLKKYGRITLEKNVYWSVLKTNGKYNKIKEISKKTRDMKICQ